MRTMRTNNRKLKKKMSREIYLTLKMLVLGKQTIKLFNSACIPHVQSLIFHAYSSSKDDEFISGESTLVEADCRRANRPSGETSWYHEAQTVFLIF